eukprot:TRINITY_DN30181_c0_g1_i1.p1 TRINITY_DN30181_c0_g1~~TRINITY_DN30181_c0_g1_i1.p1  ORF type:complete len:228 (+),score=50.93 TRINITY_DN30181_c0_g1_i1:231-914(+)
MTAAVIEGERKFTLDDPRATSCALEQHGAYFLSHKSFHDVYYDCLPSLALSRKNLWLRTREFEEAEPFWELKAGVLSEPGCQCPSSGATSFLEMTAIPEILDMVSRTTGLPHTESEDPKDAFGLEPFASFRTDRVSYSFAHATLGEFRIDIDSADFGFVVGEIERLVDVPDQVAEAERSIMVVAAELGLCLGQDDTPPGKMETYLWRVRPDDYRTLEQAGALTGRCS